MIQILLQTLLVLLCDRLVHLQHGQHQVPDFLDSDDLESFVKEFDDISGRTREKLIRPMINLDTFFLRFLRLGRENVENHGKKHAMDLDRVGVAKSHEPVVESVVTAAILAERVVVLVGPVDHLQGLVRIQLDGVLLPVVSEQFQYVRMGQVHVETYNVGSLLRLGKAGVKRRHKVVPDIATVQK